MTKFELKPEQMQVSNLFDYSRIEKFIIPIFQRPYSWERSQCEQLWDDVSDAYKAMKSHQGQTDYDPSYFLGSIIVYGNLENKKELNIVDGQQRITTLLLLLCAIYTTLDGKLTNAEFCDEGQKQEIKNILNMLAQMIWKPKELLSFNSKIDKHSPRLIRDNLDETESYNIHFKNILENGYFFYEDTKCPGPQFSSKQFIEKYEKTLSNYSSIPFDSALNSNECINYIYYIDKCNNMDLNNLKELISFLLSYCYILLINTSSEESALDTFEILNDRGMQLSDADIFKNIISKSYTNFSESRTDGLDKFKADWLELNKALKTKEAYSSDLEEVFSLDGIFRHYMYAVRMSSDNASKSKEPRLREFYTKTDSSILKQQSILKDLTEMANFMVDVLELREPLDEVIDYNESLIDIDVKYAVSLLNKYQKKGRWCYLISTFWYCYRQYANKDATNNKIFKEKFRKFMNYCTSVLFLKSILTGSASDADIPQLCEMLALQSLKERIKPSFKPFKAYFALDPDNQSITDTIRENRLILFGQLNRFNKKNKSAPIMLDEARKKLEGDTSKLNHLVLLYAYHFDKKSKNNLYSEEHSQRQPILLKSTIEHILPQKWEARYSTQWLKDCDNDKSKVKEYVEHLGNKIILDRERNIRASDRDFVSKVKCYSDKKELQTFELEQFTKKYKNKTEWTKIDVDKRTKEMINVIIDYIHSGIEEGIA